MLNRIHHGRARQHRTCSQPVNHNVTGVLRFVACSLLAGCADESRFSECADPFPFVGAGASEVLLTAAATGRTTKVAGRPDGRVGVSDSASVVAHEFVVREFLPIIDRTLSASGLIDRRDFAASDTFLAVPWAHDEACTWVQWREVAWVPPGAEAVFRVSRARFSNGRQVVDLLGWYGPYPYGDSLRVKASLPAPDDLSDWLSPREFMSLQRQLPNLAPERTRSEQLRDIEHQFRTGSTNWLERFPGPEVLRRAREWADSSGAL